MSKSKKHKTKGIENLKLISTETLQLRTKTDLEQQNYRRAKEWLKELCNRDKDQFLPQLVQCYENLFSQLLEKGRTADAKTVLDRIRQLAGNQAVALLEEKLAKKSENSGATATGQQASEKTSFGTIADKLVLSFTALPDGQENRRELASIHEALAAISDERYADALQALKQVGLKSVFAGWRLFIKGLCAFYTDDDERAREAFLRLEKEPYLSKAARPFLMILNEQTTSPAKSEALEPLLRQVCAILHKKELEHILPRAEYLWQTRRYGDSYEHVARTMAGFPSEKGGLTYALSRFYFNVVFHLGSSLEDKYLDKLYSIITREKKNLVASLLLFRAVTLYSEHDDTITDKEIIQLWQDFLKMFERVHGDKPCIRALIYARLGDFFSRQRESDPFKHVFYSATRKKEVRNARLAEENYCASLQLNNGDKEVHFALLNIYSQTGENAKRNKCLDEISRLFPDDKNSLVANGGFCVERKAFIKGIEYLKRAFRLDPLDQRLKEHLIVSYIKASLHFVKKKDVRRFREFMEEAMELGEAGIVDFNRGIPYLQARFAALEWLAGNETEGNILLEKVVSDNAQGSQLTFFTYLISRIYGAPAQHWSKLEKKVREIFRKPIPALAADFIEIILYVDKIGMQKPWLAHEFNLLGKYAEDAAKQACAPQTAEKIVRYAFAQMPWKKRLGHLYIANILRQDPQNPLFLHFQFLEKTNNMRNTPRASDLQQLKNILAIATERNERSLINILTREIREIEQFLSIDDRKKAFVEDEFEPSLEELIENAIKQLNSHVRPKPRKSKESQKKKVIANEEQQQSLFDDIPF